MQKGKPPAKKSTTASTSSSAGLKKKVASSSTGVSKTTKSGTTKQSPKTSGSASKASNVSSKKSSSVLTTSTGTKSQSKSKAPKPKEMSEEEKAQHRAALKIQSTFRGHQTRVRVEKERVQALEKKAALEKEMEELRQKAWYAQLEYDRKQEAKARKKAEEERKKRKEEERLRKLLLEAAFDGEIEDVMSLLEAGAKVDVSDVHGNTLMSEAAAGGHADVIRILASKDAEPNIVGEFGRTPLWRAAFLGKEDVILPLLECGADPRITNQDGELPADVANNESIKSILIEWDIEQTKVLLDSLAQRKQEILNQKLEESASLLRSVEEIVKEAESHHTIMQRHLLHARDELEKRIHEYDICVEESKPAELVEVARQQIKVAEDKLQESQVKARQASDDLAMAKLNLRETEQAQKGEEGETREMTEVGITVDIRELDDILFKDIGNRLKEDGRPAFIIDVSSRASVFLQYADTNNLNALSREHTSPNRLRRSIIGAIRYGKPFVLDLMDVVGLWDRIQSVFDDVLPGLLNLMITRNLLKNEKYMELSRKEDGEEYEANKFQESRIDNFKFIIVTSNKSWEKDFLQSFYTINVKVNQ